MTADQGGTIWATWVEYGGVRFKLDDGGLVQRQPQQPWSPATQLGPADRPPLDQRLAALSFGDTSGGMATLDLNEQDGITKFWWANMETRFKGRVALPAQPLPLASLAATSFDLRTPVRLTVLPNDATGPVFLALQQGGPGLPAAGAVSLRYKRNASDGTWSVAALPARATHAANWHALHVIVGPTGVRTSPDGLTWTLRDPTVWVGLAVHDNKLWSYNVTNAQLAWCLDPTLNLGVPGGWTLVGDDLDGGPGEYVTDLADWRDKGGSPALALCTNRRLLQFEDEPGEWHEVWPPMAGIVDDYTLLYPGLHVWARDQQLYLCLPGRPQAASSLYLMQFTGSTDQRGPGRGPDLNLAQFGSVQQVHGNVHFLYAFCGPADGTGATNAGAVLAQNETGGWHTVYMPDDTPRAGALAADPQAVIPHGPIVGGCYWRGTLYVLHQDGTLVGVEERDDLVAPPQRLRGAVDSRVRVLYLPETDCGLPNHLKLGVYFYIDARLPNRSPGLVPGSRLDLFYSADGQGWHGLPYGAPLLSHPVGLLTTLTTTGGQASGAWPLSLPLPDGDWTRQDGLLFRRIQPVLLYQGPGNSVPSTLGEVTLFYKRWLPQRYAYQFVVDLTRATFPDDETLFGGRSAGELYRRLLQFVDAQQLYPFRFGTNDWAVTVPAADLQVAARQDVGERRGSFQVTVRDLSAYPSGGEA